MEVANQPGSKSAVSDEVQLFTLPKTDTSAKGYRILEYMPISDNITPAEFLIPASDQFIDLNRSYFTAKLRLVKTDGNAIANGDNLFPTIGLIHTMIKQMTVHWNGTLLNPQSDTYPYRWYFTTLLNYTPAEGNSILQTEGWMAQEPSTGYVPLDVPCPLTAGNLDSATPDGAYTALSDEQKSAVLAFQREKKKYQTKSWNTLFFKPMQEVFYTGKLVPPGIEQRFTFDFNNPNFYLNGEGAAGRFSKDDIQLRFHMCQLTVDPPLYKQIVTARHSGRQNIRIATVRSEVRVYTLGANERQFNEGNIFQGRIPQRLMVGLLHPNSFNGDVTYHPYAFQKFGVNMIKQLIHGEEYPYRAMELKHDSSENDMAGYYRFLQAGGFLDKGEACMLTPGMWGQDRNCTCFLFDNTANGKADGPLMNPRQKGDVRLVFTLGDNVAHAITVVVWGEFENVLAADPNGAILYDIYN